MSKLNRRLGASTLDDAGHARVALARLPQSQVETDLPSSLLVARRVGNVDFKLMRMNLSGGTARSPQKELQVEEKPWIADQDVQSRNWRSGVAAGGAFSHCGHETVPVKRTGSAPKKCGTRPCRNGPRPARRSLPSASSRKRDLGGDHLRKERHFRCTRPKLARSVNVESGVRQPSRRARRGARLFCAWQIRSGSA